MNQKGTTPAKGVWGTHPDGVKFVSFAMPKFGNAKTREFQFTAPMSDNLCKVSVTDDKEIIGIIILMRPSNE